MSIKHRLRSKKTEELVELVQSGFNEALELIVERYYPMVVKISSKYYAPWAQFEDLVQNGLVGLIKAAYYYQPDKSGFSSFAWRSIESELKSFLTYLNRKKNKMLTDAVSVDQLNVEESEEPGYIFEDSSVSTQKSAVAEIILEQAKQHLKDLEKEIVELWASGESYEEIGRKLNVEFKKIDNTIQKFKRIVREKISPILFNLFFED
ncbi:sigma-70 family RNA polymerase sigma factor [Pseudothermotoga thermarum]|uniref:RNA polymerase, sigma 30 subunit, SigH n=1 Tax=Pseudothermotoga thermarum DSM 5069 TaxID=688269 RepID=F7YVB8_9THEM|nr:sigma-70 family RNA polymerase sigma factor [Pseudothermotoga thermarum]AEH50421.1 RNA polymerase, sigma 30 subunit, SigH [Pseudothermotoga thermarum DSM 5069]